MVFNLECDSSFRCEHSTSGHVLAVDECFVNGPLFLVFNRHSHRKKENQLLLAGTVARPGEFQIPGMFVIRLQPSGNAVTDSGARWQQFMYVGFAFSLFYAEF